MDIERRRERHKANKANAIRRAREFITLYFASHPCVDCGKTDPMILTFDHVRGEKRDNVADMVLKGLSVAAIAEEISKCDVVCFNCHSLRTQERTGACRWRMGKLGRL